MNPRIRLVSSPKAQMMVGPAFTVKCRAGDNLTLHAALNFCSAGDVLVVSNEEDNTRALMGEVMMAYLYHTKKVAGVKTPALGEIHYEIRPFNAFVKPAWYPDGVRILQELSRLGIESEVYLEKARILDYNRKKTTQKVNLYEKVQIPGYQEAIRKIKRYMEDEENLSKASSKIVKNRHAQEEEEASQI